MCYFDDGKIAENECRKDKNKELQLHYDAGTALLYEYFRVMKYTASLYACLFAFRREETDIIDLFEHNKTAYDSAVSLLSETSKAAIIHPTDTGKSSAFLRNKALVSHIQSRGARAQEKRA